MPERIMLDATKVLFEIGKAACEGVPVPQWALEYYKSAIMHWRSDGLTLDEAFGRADPEDRKPADNNARLRDIKFREVYSAVVYYQWYPEKLPIIRQAIISFIL
jgi:hypothetical protein